MHVPKLFLRRFFSPDRQISKATYKCRDARRKQKNEQQLPLPSKSNTGISTNPTNTKHVPTTTRKCLRNQLSPGTRERPHRKHRPVSCHLPCRKPNVYKILPKWLASHNGLPRFSLPKRGRQERNRVNYGNSTCRP